MSTTSLNALVKFYLDQSQVRRDKYNHTNDFFYPEEKDVFNRQGKNWNVFDIDVRPKARPVALADSDIKSAKFSNPWLKPTISAPPRSSGIVLDDSSWTLYLIDLYFYAYSTYPFVFKCYSADGSLLEGAQVTSSVKSLTIYGTAYKYIVFNGPSNATKIEAYLSNGSQTPFFTSESSSIDSRAMMEEHKFLPVRLWSSGHEVKDVIFEYRREEARLDSAKFTSDSTGSYYGQTFLANTLKISQKDKSIRLEKDITEIEVVFGFMREISSNDFIYRKTSLPIAEADFEDAELFFYFGKEELTMCEKKGSLRERIWSILRH